MEYSRKGITLKGCSSRVWKGELSGVLKPVPIRTGAGFNYVFYVLKGGVCHVTECCKCNELSHLT